MFSDLTWSNSSRLSESVFVLVLMRLRNLELRSLLCNRVESDALAMIR